MPMRIALSFVFGLAAALPIPPAGYAKELPRSPSEPKSTGCEWAGPGFAKIEGSSTCVKVGGAVRSEYEYSSGGRSYAPAGSGQ